MDIHSLFYQIIDKPLNSLAIICNLILIESLLSVDNAAVVATMVLDLSRRDRMKALSYGIVGAYIFRGVCLFFAVYLIKIWWLKPLGGIYLVYLFIKYFVKKARHRSKKGPIEKKNNSIYNAIVKYLGKFWATVLLVEVMDMVFSIDNVFAAVAFTENIILIWTGVFIGILAMRIVARGFVTLIERFPFLEVAAFAVLGVLGLKLSLSVPDHFYPGNSFNEFLASEKADMGTSVLTILIFFLPLISSLLFNYPKKHAVKNVENLKK
jgi:YkoY family integral membrane protein